MKQRVQKIFSKKQYKQNKIYITTSTFYEIFQNITSVLLLSVKYSSVYLSLPPTRQDLTEGQKPEGRLKWGLVIYEALCFDVTQGRINGAPMRLELTRVGLLVKVANHYTIKGALLNIPVCVCVCD